MDTKITTLAELIAARQQKRAVTCPSSPNFKGPLPAAFMANLTGEVLHRLMTDGMWLYTKQQKVEGKA